MLSVAVRMEEPFLPLPERERIVVVVIIMTCKACVAVSKSSQVRLV